MLFHDNVGLADAEDETVDVAAAVGVEEAAADEAVEESVELSP